MSAADELAGVNSLEETAAFLRIEPHKLKRFAQARKIGSLKQGVTYTFTREAIEAYVKANLTPATPPNAWGFTDASARRLGRAS